MGSAIFPSTAHNSVPWDGERLALGAEIASPVTNLRLYFKNLGLFLGEFSGGTVRHLRTNDGVGLVVVDTFVRSTSWARNAPFSNVTSTSEADIAWVGVDLQVNAARTQGRKLRDLAIRLETQRPFKRGQFCPVYRHTAVT